MRYYPPDGTIDEQELRDLSSRLSALAYQYMFQLDALVELLRIDPVLACMLMFIMPGEDQRVQIIEPLLVALAATGEHSIMILRDIFRSLPRSAIERELPEALRCVLSYGPDADGLNRLFEMVVEVRATESLELLRAHVAGSDDTDFLFLLEASEGIEHDEACWGRLVQEWPVVDGHKGGHPKP